ncbi:MAG: ABC transporter permease [Desulfuromonadaceae bacterium]|nr:ABC transporter permease [Desulfuromonadaceae bacterium]
MIIGANIKEAVRSLLSSKQRTVLALIGIVIGIGSVIAMVSIGKIVQEESLRQFKEMGTDVLTIESQFGGGEPSTGGRITRSAPKSKIKLADVLAIPTECPGISAVAPSVRGNGEASYGGKKLQNAGMIGVTESFLGINKLKISQGRFISDLDAHNQFCTIGSMVATEMRTLGSGDVIGKKLRVGQSLYTVVGVTAEVLEGGMRRFQPNETIYVHITSALRSSREAEISEIIARVSTGVTNTVARDQVLAYFKSKTKKSSVRVTSPEEIIAQMEKQMQMFTLLLGAIGSISLIVGGVGVMNVMLVSVSERRREIGIRRALGAKRGDIRGQFLIESIILSLIGGVLGILFGVGASVIISHFAKWHFVLSSGAILLGVGVSNAVGIFFGYYPARQASLLDPIVALKSD